MGERTEEEVEAVTQGLPAGLGARRLLLVRRDLAAQACTRRRAAQPDDDPHRARRTAVRTAGRDRASRPCTRSCTGSSASSASPSARSPRRASWRRLVAGDLALVRRCRPGALPARTFAGPREPRDGRAERCAPPVRGPDGEPAVALVRLGLGAGSVRPLHVRLRRAPPAHRARTGSAFVGRRVLRVDGPLADRPGRRRGDGRVHRRASAVPSHHRGGAARRTATAGTCASAERPVPTASATSGYRGVGSDVTERVLAERKILELARFDTLTGLPNRSMFMDEAPPRDRPRPPCRPRGRRCCSSTSTASSRSTTRSATPPATSCSRRSPARFHALVREADLAGASRWRRVRRDRRGQRRWRATSAHRASGSSRPRPNR